MCKDFLSFALELRNKKLLETEHIFQNIKIQLIDKFRLNFLDNCKKICDMQKSNDFLELSYIEYTMLYSNYLNKNYIADIRIYDKDWYLDKKQLSVGTFDVSPLFEKYSELWEELLKKAYSLKVNPIEVKEFMIDSLQDFYLYVVSICRFGIVECLKDNYFASIRKTDEFEINVGGYMTHTESIYKVNKNKDNKMCSEWFKERLEFEYAFEDFTGLDFSGEDLSEIDFRYSDLRCTDLRNINLQDSMLIGTRFCGADMLNADLRYSMLFEADFTGANLMNAKFISIEADAGIPDDTLWELVGFMGVSFRNANLQNADFTKSSFIGADFTGAAMNGAIFDKKHIEQMNLSEEQRNVIVVR